MLIGFGEVGKRIYKYINSFEFSKLFIVVRELNKIALNDPRVKIISYNEKNEFIKDIDIIALRRKIGYVIQQIGLFPHLNIEKNIN